MLDVLVPQRNLKVLANAVACLGKIGKDICIEADQEQLILRALNDSNSVFAAFYLKRDGIFEQFRCGQQDGSSTSCKVLVKAVQHVLRSLKRVSSLRMYIEECDVEPHLVFDRNCEGGVLRRHRFHLQDWQVVHAVYDRGGASYLGSQASQLMQLMEHVHGSSEVAMYASRSHVRVKTFRSDDPLGLSSGGDAPSSAVLTSAMTVSSADFDTYHFNDHDHAQEEVGLVFGVRELKALLSFCDSGECQHVSFFYHEGGRPILFAAEEEATLAVELHMASGDPATPPDRPQAQAQQHTAPGPKKAKRRQEEEEAEEADVEGMGGMDDDGTTDDRNIPAAASVRATNSQGSGVNGLSGKAALSQLSMHSASAADVLVRMRITEPAN